MRTRATVCTLIAACAAMLPAQSVTVSPPTSTITITTKRDSLKVGDTLRTVTAVVRSASGATSSASKVRWSTSPAGVVRIIDTSGTNGQRVALVGLAPGTAQAVATWTRTTDGLKFTGAYAFKVSGSTPPVQPPVDTTTTPPVTPPTQPPSGAGVHYFDDFSKYTTSAQLNSGVMKAGNFWYAPPNANGSSSGHDYVNVNNAGSISYDPVEKALRYDWPNRSALACNNEISTFINPRINPLSIILPNGARDLWVEFVSKESAGFAHGNYDYKTVNAAGDTVSTVCGGRSYKFFLLNFERAGMLGRAGLYLGDGVPAAPLGPKDVHLSTTGFMDFSDQKGAYQYQGGLPIGGAAGWGGVYHRWTMELKGIGTAAATFTTYLDGKKLHTLASPFLNGENVHSGPFVLYFSMGANMNSGPSHAESRWFREFGVYTVKPPSIP